jgi:hypothetical protein
MHIKLSLSYELWLNIRSEFTHVPIDNNILYLLQLCNIPSDLSKQNNISNKKSY